MATWKVYVAPLTGENAWGDWQDLTEFVDSSSIGDISQAIDKDDFSIGLAKNSSVSFKLKNDTGKFNDENSIDTIFRYRREGSRVKITYFAGDSLAICGMAICGIAILGDEITVFEGLLAGDSFGQDVNTDMLTMTALGYESIFESIEFDYSKINASTAPLTMLYNILNVEAVTSLLTLDFANWTSGANQPFDVTTEFEDIDTMQEAVEIFLGYLNAFLFIDGTTVYVRNKEESAELLYTFYGQASDLGVENIQNISDFKDGTNRLYNLFRWNDDDISYKLSNSASIGRYGLKKTEEIGGKSYSNTSKINSILNSYLIEYDQKKKEFILTAPLQMDMLGLIFMDKVNIDYPVPIYPAQGGIMPIWNTPSMTWGEFYWPETYFNFSISSVEYFKIIGIKVSPRSNLISFTLRGV